MEGRLQSFCVTFAAPDAYELLKVQHTRRCYLFKKEESVRELIPLSSGPDRPSDRFLELQKLF